jgi:hypothetical protein
MIHIFNGKKALCRKSTGFGAQTAVPFLMKDWTIRLTGFSIGVTLALVLLV